MNTHSAGERIAQLVRKVTLKLEPTSGEIAAADIALEVSLMIDPERNADPLTNFAACQHYAQIARGILRHMYPVQTQAKEEQIEIPELSSRLQDRYAVKRRGREVYVRRGDLKAIEVKSIVKKLRKASKSLSEHADQLEREFEMSPA